MRIFILDNADQTISLIMNYLGEFDYRDSTEVFHQTDSLLEAYHKERPGMVFIRVGQPEIDGIQAARAIKKMDEWAKITLVSESKSYVMPAWEVRATDYLLEPIEYERFIETMCRAG